MKSRIRGKHHSIEWGKYIDCVQVATKIEGDGRDLWKISSEKNVKDFLNSLASNGSYVKKHGYQGSVSTHRAIKHTKTRTATGMRITLPLR